MMVNKTDYYVFLSVNLLVFIFIALFLYQKRRIFNSVREPAFIIILGLLITITSAAAYVSLQTAWKPQDLVTFLLLQDWGKSWILTRTCTLGYDLSFAGIIALLITIFQRKARRKQ